MNVMEISTVMFLIIVLLTMIMEGVDSSIGMMYGIVLGPLLIGFGFFPTDVVPFLMLRQAIGGIVTSFRHHRLKNAFFIVWVLIGRKVSSPGLVISLCIGAVIGGYIGPALLNKIGDNHVKLTKAAGLIAFISGIYAMIKIF
jgi:uncharacterized membrane protein YfcA